MRRRPSLVNQFALCVDVHFALNRTSVPKFPAPYPARSHLRLIFCLFSVWCTPHREKRQDGLHARPDSECRLLTAALAGELGLEQDAAADAGAVQTPPGDPRRRRPRRNRAAPCPCKGFQVSPAGCLLTPAGCLLTPPSPDASRRSTAPSPQAQSGGSLPAPLSGVKGFGIGCLLPQRRFSCPPGRRARPEAVAPSLLLLDSRVEGAAPRSISLSL